MKLPEKTPEIRYIPEPRLAFGHGQLCDYPKDGLYLFGPADAHGTGAEVTIGVVGTDEGVGLMRDWLAKIRKYVAVAPPRKTEKKDRPHLSDFPGLREAFGISVRADAIVIRALQGKAIDDATRALNQHEAVAQTADLYIAEVEKHLRNEERTVDVWFFVLPDIVYERCRPKSLRKGVALLKGTFERRKRSREDIPLFAGVIDTGEEAVFEDVPDFHRHVKAKLLQHHQTSQLVRETTLAPERFLNTAGYPERTTQDRTTVAWNLATAIYYKTQPSPPWKLAGVRPGVCYIGMVYKLLPNHPQEHACCAAQMFLNEGDGMVFRGANGPWKTGRNEFHLRPDAAEDLLKKVLETFADRHGELPRELFIHGRTLFNDAEWAAFTRACPANTNLVGVRIRPTFGDVKLYRDGDYPVLRGTAMLLDEKNAYLWTTGFVPRLATYMGPETPNPVHVTILRSSGPAPPIMQVLQDILGLTKINYNACNLGDGLPVTVAFADKVGDVLVMGSARNQARQPFKFYV